jgi:hypothetical protein
VTIKVGATGVEEFTEEVHGPQVEDELELGVTGETGVDELEL